MGVVFVGPGHDLVFRPDRMVLGHSDHEVLRLAPGIGGPLADAMGQTVEKTNGRLMAGPRSIADMFLCAVSSVVISKYIDVIIRCGIP